MNRLWQVVDVVFVALMEASTEPVDGAKAGVTHASLDDNGPSGVFFHMGEIMPC